MFFTFFTFFFKVIQILIYFCNTCFRVLQGSYNIIYQLCRIKIGFVRHCIIFSKCIISFFNSS
nr:MAG TPA: hypothetical protein [Caudoviricetes sp.]DAX10749.1 MAG TPA: hypothetical protein [Bacteriophage sp.]